MSFSHPSISTGKAGRQGEVAGGGRFCAGDRDLRRQRMAVTPRIGALTPSLVISSGAIPSTALCH